MGVFCLSRILVNTDDSLLCFLATSPFPSCVASGFQHFTLGVGEAKAFPCPRETVHTQSSPFLSTGSVPREALAHCSEVHPSLPFYAVGILLTFSRAQLCIKRTLVIFDTAFIGIILEVFSTTHLFIIPEKATGDIFFKELKTVF